MSWISSRPPTRRSSQELNIWYHTLNCGFRTRISGETDFPCITDARVGGGRSYVHLPQTLTYDAWCEGVRAGRSYVSDGFSHLMNFTANGLEAGTNGGELRLERPGTVQATVRAASLLSETAPARPTPSRQQSPMESGARARCRIARRHRRGDRQRPSGGQPAADGGRRPAGSGVRRSRCSEAVGLRSASSARPTRIPSSCWSAAGRFARRREAPSGASRPWTSAGRR